MGRGGWVGGWARIGYCGKDKRRDRGEATNPTCLLTPSGPQILQVVFEEPIFCASSRNPLKSFSGHRYITCPSDVCTMRFCSSTLHLFGLVVAVCPQRWSVFPIVVGFTCGHAHSSMYTADSYLLFLVRWSAHVDAGRTPKEEQQRLAVVHCNCLSLSGLHGRNYSWFFSVVPYTCTASFYAAFGSELPFPSMLPSKHGVPSRGICV